MINHYDYYPRIDAADIVGWLEQSLVKAKAERAALAAAQVQAHNEQVRRGRCYAGHLLAPDNEIPMNSLGTAPCGYCSNIRERLTG